MPGTVDLHRMRLSAPRLRGLSLRERYVFLLMGHIFNELVVLQKLALATRPPLDAEVFQKTGGVGVTLVLLRALGGKTYEALLTLRRHSIDRDLRRDYFQPSGLSRAWDETLQAADALKWLCKFRNRHAFHYMTLGQWQEGLGDDACEDAEVIVGPRYGDTFFHWSDALANLQMMRLVNSDKPFDGLATILEELGAVVGQLLDVLANALQVRMKEHLIDKDALDDAVTLEAPLLSEIRVPYFWAYEN